MRNRAIKQTNIRNVVLAGAFIVSLLAPYASNHVGAMIHGSSKPEAPPYTKVGSFSEKATEGPQLYAVIVNGSGPSNPAWYSQASDKESLEGMFSFYRTLAKNGIEKSNIALLVYNPTGITFQDNPDYDAVQHEIDGISTRQNFLDCLNTAKKIMRPEDKLVICISNASPDPPEEIKKIQSFLDLPSSPYLYFANSPEYLTAFDMARELSAIKGEKIILGQLHENSNFLLKMGTFNQGTSQTSSRYDSLNDTLVVNAANLDNGNFFTDLSRIIDKGPAESIQSAIAALQRENHRYDIQDYYLDGHGCLSPVMAADSYKRPLLPSSTISAHLTVRE